MAASKPEKGYYYHYKHKKNGPVNNSAYEVLGTALHGDTTQLMVVYRPLYMSFILENDIDFDVRPLETFTEEVEVEEVMMPRFRKITDAHAIKELDKIKETLWNKN